MDKTRILLTGADSFMGSHILVQLLSYETVSVRAVVKSAEAAQTIQQRGQNGLSTLDFFTISEQDTTIPGAFDSALHDVSNPFHAVVYTLESSPLQEADCLARFIKIETEAIIDFLRSIQNISSTVTRVVIVASLIPFARWLGDSHTDSLSGQTDTEQGPSSSLDREYVLAASQASKNIVNDAVLAWIKQSGAGFDVVFITAPSVYGPTAHLLEHPSELTEANRRLWNICSNEHLGRDIPSMYCIDHFADVRDIADVTVSVTSIEKASNKSLVVSADIMPSNSEIAQFLVARFTELQGRIRIDGSPAGQPQHEQPALDFLDNYLLTTVLGMRRLRSSDVTITDTVQQMLDLQQRKARSSVTQG